MADKRRKVLTIDESEEPKKYTFVVRPGQTFGLRRLRPGQKVELTVAEAIPFSDKVEPLDREFVLPKDASPDELAEAGYAQVPNPTELTDRNVLTPAQRAETSQMGSTAQVIPTGTIPAPPATPKEESTAKETAKKDKK